MEVVFVDPNVAVLAPAPVATLTVVAAASAEILIAFVPEATVNVPPPKDAAPPVAVVVVPTVRDVVVCTDPGATKADGTEKVRVFNPPVVVIWLAVPAIVTAPAAVGTTGFVPASGTNESIATPPPSRSIVMVDPLAEVTTPEPPAIKIFPEEGVAVPESPVRVLSDPAAAPSEDQVADRVLLAEEREVRM